MCVIHGSINLTSNTYKVIIKSLKQIDIMLFTYLTEKNYLMISEQSIIMYFVLAYLFKFSLSFFYHYIKVQTGEVHRRTFNFFMI